MPNHLGLRSRYQCHLGDLRGGLRCEPGTSLGLDDRVQHLPVPQQANPLSNGGFALKKAVQLVAITAVTQLLDDAAGVGVGGFELAAGLGLLLPQAATPAASAQASRAGNSTRCAIIRIVPYVPLTR